MLDDGLLREFAQGFFGFGDREAPYWIIGIEEGGGYTPEEVQRRYETWSSRNRREIEDAAEFHRAIGFPQLFTPEPKHVSTWTGAMKVLLSLKGLWNDERSPTRLRHLYQSGH